MAFLGHPLVSDVVYGGAAAAGMLRQGLHAERLEFEHPMTGEPMKFLASLPPDFVQALTLWGLRYNETNAK